MKMRLPIHAILIALLCSAGAVQASPLPGADPPMTVPNTFVYRGDARYWPWLIERRPPGVASAFETILGCAPPASEVAADGGARFIFATNVLGDAKTTESAVWYAFKHAGASAKTARVYVIPGTGFADPRIYGHWADTPGGGTLVSEARNVYPVEELTVTRKGKVIGRRYLPDVNPAVVERQNALLDLYREQLSPLSKPAAAAPAKAAPAARRGAAALARIEQFASRAGSRVKGALSQLRSGIRAHPTIRNVAVVALAVGVDLLVRNHLRARGHTDTFIDYATLNMPSIVGMATFDLFAYGATTAAFSAMFWGAIIIGSMMYEVGSGIMARINEPGFNGFTPEEDDAWLMHVDKHGWDYVSTAWSGFWRSHARYWSNEFGW